MDATTAIPRTAPAATRPAWTAFVRISGDHRVANALVTAGIAAALTATAMVLVLHLLPRAGGVNPVHGMLSDYALRPDGWVFEAALVLTGIGSLALAAVLVRHHVVRGFAAVTCLLVWCAGLVGIAVFAKDRTEVHQTIHGGVHLWFTAASCAALPLLGLLLGIRHWRHRYWRRFARWSVALSLANVPCLLPFVIAFFLNVMTHSERYTGPATGIIERVMSGLDIAALLLLGVWAYAAAHNRSAVLLAKRPRDS